MARANPILDIIASVSLVFFTAVLAYVSFLQSQTLDLQRQIQAAATRSNVAPSYGGRSTEGMIILNMTNTGEIPAREVLVSESHGWISSDRDLPALCARAAPINGTLTIHPGFKVESHLKSPPAEEMETSDSRIYAVCGEISFADDLGKGVPSKYCLYFSEAELTDPERVKNLDHTICHIPTAGT